MSKLYPYLMVVFLLVTLSSVASKLLWIVLFIALVVLGYVIIYFLGILPKKMLPLARFLNLPEVKHYKQIEDLDKARAKIAGRILPAQIEKRVSQFVIGQHDVGGLVQSFKNQWSKANAPGAFCAVICGGESSGKSTLANEFSRALAEDSLPGSLRIAKLSIQQSVLPDWDEIDGLGQSNPATICILEHIERLDAESSVLEEILARREDARMAGLAFLCTFSIREEITDEMGMRGSLEGALGARFAQRVDHVYRMLRISSIGDKVRILGKVINDLALEFDVKQLDGTPPEEFRKMLIDIGSDWDSEEGHAAHKLDRKIRGIFQNELVRARENGWQSVVAEVVDVDQSTVILREASVEKKKHAELF